MGWRYSPEIRALAVEYCEEAREAGGSMAAVAADLGITPMSLSRWLDRGAPTSAMLPVQVIESPVEIRSSALIAVTPGGLRIEGLDWTRVLDLVRVFG
jgi:transposase-like protein